MTSSSAAEEASADSVDSSSFFQEMTSTFVTLWKYSVLPSYDDYSFVDFYEGSNKRDLINEMYEEYEEEFHTSYIPDENQRKIWRYAEDWLKQCCYGLDIRMNGVSGQWEMLLHHLEPLADVPSELRFPPKTKSKNKKNSQEKEN